MLNPSLEMALQANEREMVQPVDIAEEQTTFKPFPVAGERCFDGLAGDCVRLAAPCSEADPMALLSQFLVYFGNIVGRNPFMRVEADRHNTNLFCIIVGATGAGRKGTSFRRVKELFTGIDEEHDQNCHASGLATGEGLVWRVRDPGPGKTKSDGTNNGDPGVSDKRLLVVEGEFVQVLRVQGREGNTLSGTIRNLYDTGTVENLTKNSPLKATGAHVSIIGHITPDELLHALDEIDAANGYANRFLFIMVRRQRLLPFGSEIPASKLETLKTQLAQAVHFSRHVEQMQFTLAARGLWATEYERLETSRFGYLAKITQRASPYVLRLSCIYALLDQKAEIDVKHLESALAVWQYAEDSTRHIFGDRLGNEPAERIRVALLENKGGLSKTAIRDLFNRHIPKTKLDEALQVLLDSGVARFERESTGGAKREIWFPCV